jgi:hypothetical protein
MVPELRPRGVGEMLDASVVLYRARFVRLLLVAAIVVVPTQFITTLVLLSAQADSAAFGVSGFSPGSNSPDFDAGSAAVQLGATVTILVLSVISTAFVSAVCTRIVADAYVARGDNTKEALGVVARRIFALLGLSVLVAITQVAIITIVLFAVAVPVLILEGAGVFKAMGRSSSLTISNFWRCLGVIAAAQLLTAVVTFGLAAGVAVVFRDGGSGANIVAQGFANAIAAGVTTPFLAATIVVLYFDLRIRNEGFDLQMLMQRRTAPPIAA